MYQPVTITWPTGETVTLSRAGDIVTAEANPGNVTTLRTTIQPIPDWAMPLGEGVVYAIVNPSRYLVAVADDPTSSSGIQLLASTATAPFLPGQVSWAADPVTDPLLRELAERVRRYVSPDARTVVIPDAENYITDCTAEALALVTQQIGAAATVPVEIRDRAVVEAASELYHRRAAPNGISQFAAPDGSALRVARDPMNAARAILAPYLPLGFA